MVDRRFDRDAEEFGAVVRTALTDAGGYELVMHSEAARDLRTAEIEPLLAALGVFDLEPATDPVQLQAAALACRAAGRFALPYPVAERLAARLHDDGPAALALVDAFGTGTARIAHADLPLRWYAAAPGGEVFDVEPGPEPAGGRLGAFVVDSTLVRSTPGARAPEVVAPALVLSGFTLLGMLEGAFDLTHGHVRERIQFGTPLVGFQVVQHDLADVLVAVRLFEQQLRYALWSCAQGRPGALVDAVAARAAGLSAADVTLRTGHQLHGATGFCDESAISWISRHSQALRRLPHNLPATRRWLAQLVLAQGFDGPFRDSELVGT